MIKKVKSKFILKQIFINLNVMIKLNLVIHNNKLQRKLGLNIFDYRLYSGRYKQEEGNKIIEFNSYNDEKIFEGKYSNGKRNGYGYEYNVKGDILFEGEYLNGKKWKGSGKDFDEETGKLIFEYEYLELMKNKKLFFLI